MYDQPQLEPMATRVALHPFLAGMSPTHLSLLTDCAMATHFKDGQTILREKELANRFYLLETGKVVVESRSDAGEPVVIETVGAGDLLGWSWMFPPHVWHFTARAIEPTNALFFYGSILRDYCERDHSLGFELFKRMSAVMTHRLRLAQHKILCLHASVMHESSEPRCRTDGDLPTPHLFKLAPEQPLPGIHPQVRRK